MLGENHYMKYQLIRDKLIRDLQEYQIEVCDSLEEINKFSFKEIVSLLHELDEYDYKSEELYVEIYGILSNLLKQNNIDVNDINNGCIKQEKEKGKYSKYLLKIH